MRRPTLAFPLVLAGGLAACSALTGNRDRDDGRCPQTYEFGNDGCAVVTGRVRDAQGRPVANAEVGIAPQHEQAAYASGAVNTGTDGAFRFQVTRFAQRTPAVTPDTISLYVRAVVFTGAATLTPPRDSVLALVTFVPVGRVPVETAADVRVPTP